MRAASINLFLKSEEDEHIYCTHTLELDSNVMIDVIYYPDDC